MRGGGRTAWRACRVPALAVSLALLAGCGDGRGGPPARPDAGHQTGSCVTATGVLVADLDGDGTTDRVSSSYTGADLTVTFGAGGGRGTEAGPRDLVGDRGADAKDVVAVVADFDRDGWNDLFIAATDAFSGDSPIEPAVSEVRLGPFSARGRGQSDHHVDLTEPRAAAVADYDHDRYPDLAAYGHAGDGVYATTARLGGAQGLDRTSDDTNSKYLKEAEQTDRQTPAYMPKADLKTFYPTCTGTTGKD
ncbi:FG-GAP repeat domain-containing protein [Streptomyces sp. 900105245]